MQDARTILHALFVATGCSAEALRYGSRTHPLVHVRHVGFWLIRHLTGASYPEIGRIMGHRDHTSVLSGCRRVEQDIREGGPRFDVLLDVIERMGKAA